MRSGSSRPPGGRWSGRLIVAIALACLIPHEAPAFSLLSSPFRKWLTSDIPPAGVPFVLDNRGEDSVTLADGSSNHGLSQVIAAVQVWNDAAGRVVVAPPTPAAITTLNLADGANSIVFNDPLGVCTGSCLAVTFIGGFDGGSTETTNGISFAAYREVDITFNATVNWTTRADASGPGCAGEFDIEGVAAHEMGHALGLGHSSNPQATLYPFASSCNPDLLPLDADDVAAIRCAYVNGAGCALCENCPPGPMPTILACGGSSLTTFSFAVSPAGNLVHFESPAGFEHLQSGTVREGYLLCYTGPSGAKMAFDINDQAGGFGAPVLTQPNGPGTLPIEVLRGSEDGLLLLRQRFTGHAFIASGGGPLDLNGDGVSCDTMQECGNCGNRTIQIFMEVTNLSSGTASNVVLVRVADLDVDGQPASNRFSRSADSVLAFRDASEAASGHGILFQGIFGAAPPEPLVQTQARSGTIDCAADSSPTPTVGDFVAKLRWSLGSISAGETKQVRLQYRRW